MKEVKVKSLDIWYKRGAYEGTIRESCGELIFKPPIDEGSCTQLVHDRFTKYGCFIVPREGKSSLVIPSANIIYLEINYK